MTLAADRFARIRAVLFDLDGTLLDSAPDLGAAADQMRVKRGLPSLALTDYRPAAGAGARGLLAVAFGIAPDHPDFAALRDEFFCNYERCLTQRTRAFPGIDALVGELLARQVSWGVVTNKAARFTEPLTRSMRLFDSALAVVSGDTTPHAKPHPEPLFEAARRLGVSPTACIYVGDDERDIVAGRAAGMLTVAANYGYLGNQSDVARWGADATINSPLGLLQLLTNA